MSFGNNFKYFVQQIKLRKQGIIIGGLVGAGLAYYAISKGIDLTTIVNSGKSFLDDIMGRNAVPTQTAIYKLYGVFISFGMVLGYFIDMAYDKLGLPRKKKR